MGLFIAMYMAII